MNTPIRRHTLLDGPLSTSYLEAGPPDAPALILLHDGAFGGSAWVSWSTCIRALASNYHVLAPDLYGFGQSSKVVALDVAPYNLRLTQVCHLVQATGVVDYIIVGTSFGGSVALRSSVDSRFSEASGFVSIGGTGGPLKTDTMLRELSHWSGTYEDLSRIVTFLADPESESFAPQMRARFDAASSVGHYRSLVAPALPLPEPLRTDHIDTWPGPLADLTRPLHLLHGKDDELFEHGWADQYASLSHLITSRQLDSRHSPNIDHPEVVSDVILDFARIAFEEVA